MTPATRVAVLSAAFAFALVATTAPAAARARPISGKLSRQGYEVIAFAPDGTARSARAKNGRFSVRPSAARVTLELRAPNGKYAGPVVIGVYRARAVVGVRAGARLGRIRINARRGYARVTRRVGERRRDASLWARAKRGVPIGNGRNFGAVRSKPPRAAPPGDLDADGVPDPIDIDVNGNRILNRFDRSGRARVAQLQTREDVGARSYLALELPHTVNANMAGFDPRQIDGDPAAGLLGVLPRFGALLLGGLNVPADPGTDVELDCGNDRSTTPEREGLIYCSNGDPPSTGTNSGYGWLTPPGVSVGDPFPACCDPDEDGMGSLVRDPSGQTTIAAIGLIHGVRSDQVVAGQLLGVRFKEDNLPREFWGILSYVYVTVPAVSSFADESGTQTQLQYPVASDGPGTNGNPFLVPDADGDGDIHLALTFWRPQRRAQSSETGDWIDIGHGVYAVDVGNDDGGSATCPQRAFSATGSLTPAPDARNTGGGPGFGLEESSDDQAANPTRTLHFTLNLTECLASAGFPLNSGDRVAVVLRAQAANPLPGPPDNARTTIWFRRQ